MITLTLEWREVLWWMQGGMAWSHLRWSVYEDMVNRVWPQCSEQERRNLWLIMRRDLGSWWRPDGWNAAIEREQGGACTSHAEREQGRRNGNGFDLANAHGEGEWKPLKGYTIDREDADGKPVEYIMDETPWMYFRQVLARFDPENQYAVTIDCTVEQESPFGDGDALFSQMMHEKSVRQATAMARDAMAKGILMPDNLIDRQQIEAERPSVTVRAYKWKDLEDRDAYFIDWSRRCDESLITKVEKIEIPDDGTM